MASPGTGTAAVNTIMTMASELKALATTMVDLHRSMMIQSPLYKTMYFDLLEKTRAMEQKLPRIIRQLADLTYHPYDLYEVVGRFTLLTIMLSNVHVMLSNVRMFLFNKIQSCVTCVIVFYLRVTQ